MRRILAFAVLAATAALAAPASAGTRVCTPTYDETTVGGCVEAVCLKLCVWRIDVDPQCSINRPTPTPVASACSRIDAHFISVGPGAAAP